MKPLRRLVLSIALMSLMVISVASFLVASNGQALPVSALSQLTYGGDPSLISPAPIDIAIVGQPYDFNVSCSAPDNGTSTWTLETNSSWLVIVAGGTGYEYCELSGSPATISTVWANLTVNDTDSYDFINWTISVRQPGLWGSVQTLSDQSTGIHDPSDIRLSSGRLKLIDADANQESVVLDGTLATLSRTNESNLIIATYEPDHITDGIGWNLSVELYPTREATSYQGAIRPVPTNGMTVYLGNDTVNMTAVALFVGDSALGLQGIRILDATTGLWSNLTTDLIPSYPNRHDDSPSSPQLSESIYGEKPDRYIVSFTFLESTMTCNITVIHTGNSIVGTANVPLPAAMPSDFKLTFVTDAALPVAATYLQLGYWMIDDICFRGLYARYPTVGPVYEYVTKGDPAWVSVKDVDGNVLMGASVTINGVSAPFSIARQRYEASLPTIVGWNEPFNYSVISDGVTLRDRMTVTVMPNLKYEKVSLPLWWNGWDWVTVFGRDDSTYSTAAVDAYSGYDHPATSYIMSNAPGGNSTSLLATQSEIGVHWPHVYSEWPSRFWGDAVNTSQTGHAVLENAYAFASRWDDPSYVGVGDTYISLACPGNSASWQQMYAEFARGTRIMGLTSNYANGAPGNHSLIGSWYGLGISNLALRWGAPDSQWYPYTTIDLMDAARGPNADGPTWPSSEWQYVFWTARNGGLQRFYNHGSVAISPTVTQLLHWVVDPKTNFSYENWKATDGEVASYVYGRWSTDIVYDPGASNSTVTAYHVSRSNPISAGYWRVPVTIAFNTSGRSLADVNITEGSRILRMSDGTLRNITGKRVMDVGYDVRGSKVYVSYFWNASSNLSFVFSEAPPEPNTSPTALFVVDSYDGNVTKLFVFDASSSSDAEDPFGSLEFRWDWNGDGIWDTDWSSNPIAYHQFATAGNYFVALQVIDRGGLTGEAQANIQVTDIEIPEMSSLLLPVISMIAVFSSIALFSKSRKKRKT